MNQKEFENNFDTREQCLKYLSKLRFSEFCCKKCRHNKAWITKEFKYECKNCRTQIAVTTDTVFYGSRIPLNLWFRSIWYIASNEEKVNALWLQNALNLGSYHTALKLLRVLQEAIICCKQEKLQGVVGVYKQTIKIRGGTAFVALASEIKENRFKWIKMGVIKGPTPDSIHSFVDNNIKRGSKLMLEYGMWDKSLFKNYSQGSIGTKDNKNKIFLNLERQIARQDICSKDKLAEYLDEFCVMTSKYNTKVTFKSLLCMLVTGNVDKGSDRLKHL